MAAKKSLEDKIKELEKEVERLKIRLKEAQKAAWAGHRGLPWR